MLFARCFFEFSGTIVFYHNVPAGVTRGGSPPARYVGVFGEDDKHKIKLLAVLISLVMSVTVFAFTGCRNLPKDEHFEAIFEVSSTKWQVTGQKLDEAVIKLKWFLALRGYTDTNVTHDNDSKIIVKTPDLDVIEKVLVPVFKPVDIVFSIQKSGNVLVPFLTAEDISSANTVINPATGDFCVILHLTTNGAISLAQITTENIGGTMQIDIARDGETKTISTAVINEMITSGTAIISGDFTYESATELATQIEGRTLFDFSLTLMTLIL